MDDDQRPVNDEEPPVDPARLLQIARLAELKLQHQDLDASIHALELSVRPDQLQIARLKRQKLFLRDQIVKLENDLMPDIIA
jgi:hypothetical protein